jgi:hypothetical protein
MVGLGTLDLILRNVGVRVMGIALVLDIAHMHANDRAADPFGLGFQLTRSPTLKALVMTARFNAWQWELPQRLEHFQAKWIPVRVKKMRYNNDLEVLSDSAESENALMPPPLLAHPDSVATPPFTESVKLVPPTPITKGLEDPYSAWRGPVELCPVSSGFEPASPQETNTFTPAAASRKNNRFR